MRQRYAWIDARLASGEPFNRDDIVRAFTVTKQTASATISEYQALKSDALRYDGARKAFVRADQAPLAPRPKGRLPHSIEHGVPWMRAAGHTQTPTRSAATHGAIATPSRPLAGKSKSLGVGRHDHPPH